MSDLASSKVFGTLQVTQDTTLNGALILNRGGDLRLQAKPGSVDSGDIVMTNGDGVELHRLYAGTNTLSYRANAGTTYQMLHTGMTHTHGQTDIINLTYDLETKLDNIGDALGGKYFTSSLDRSAGIYGMYDSTKINHIWSMGTGYQVDVDGINFGNLYGMAYKHTNNGSGGTMADGHQIVFCSSGTTGAAIGLNGNIWTKGWMAAVGEVNAASFKGNANVGGTGAAIYCPSGVYSAGTNWLYGQIITNNNAVNAGTGQLTCGSAYMSASWIGGYRLTISTSAPGSPATGDIWIDI